MEKLYLSLVVTLLFLAGVTQNIEMARKFCTEEYAPVCGWVQVQCITTPCNPVPETFPNRCHALQAGATRIEEGPCF